MDKELRSKIIALFEYRELPKLIEIGSGTLDKDYYELLIQLQADIYYLDHELETNWHVSTSAIEDRWAAIYQSLTALGVPRDKHDEYCRHIYKYQRHELELRQRRFPMRLSMEYFYFYKSCDVKLLRKLIYDKYPVLQREVKLSDWRVFDLITEVNDDVEDLYEDLDTINGNRFLLSLLQQGPTATAAIYQDYLQELGLRIADIPQPLNRQMSQTVYDDTKVLLTERLAAYDAVVLSKAVINPYVSLASEV